MSVHHLTLIRTTVSHQYDKNQVRG